MLEGAVQTDAVIANRRRPGRLADPSPELIALMRRPTAEAANRVALYDAPNFVPPPIRGDFGLDLIHLMRFGAAFTLCAAGWVAAFRIMMLMWA